jgi:hypothetical protein
LSFSCDWQMFPHSSERNNVINNSHMFHPIHTKNHALWQLKVSPLIFQRTNITTVPFTANAEYRKQRKNPNIKHVVLLFPPCLLLAWLSKDIRLESCSLNSPPPPPAAPSMINAPPTTISSGIQELWLRVFYYLCFPLITIHWALPLSFSLFLFLNGGGGCLCP